MNLSTRILCCFFACLRTIRLLSLRYRSLSVSTYTFQLGLYGFPAFNISLNRQITEVDRISIQFNSEMRQTIDAIPKAIFRVMVEVCRKYSFWANSISLIFCFGDENFGEIKINVTSLPSRIEKKWIFATKFRCVQIHLQNREALTFLVFSLEWIEISGRLSCAIHDRHIKRHLSTFSILAKG